MYILESMESGKNMEKILFVSIYMDEVYKRGLSHHSKMHSVHVDSWLRQVLAAACGI